MYRIRRLVPKQIPVCAGVKICLITRSFFFPDRECHCTVRVCPLDRRHQTADLLICKIGVFSALQDKGAESKLIPCRAAEEDLLLCEAVALGTCIAPADAAVIAVIFTVVGELAEQRIAAAKEKQFSAFQKVTLDNLFSQMAQNDMKELAIVVKADVQGSAEAVKQSLEKISNDEVRVRVIHAGVGAISKSDVDLADASNAIIIGFNVRPDNVAKEEAAATKVEMRMYRVIYDAINDVTDAMKGMLAPKFREVSLGELQVRQVYKISNVGTVAGCRVTSGKITRDSKVRVVRDGIVITEDEIASLKRFKDDAKEVAEGYECGVTLAKFADVKEGDVYEAFKMEEYRD